MFRRASKSLAVVGELAFDFGSACGGGITLESLASRIFQTNDVDGCGPSLSWSGTLCQVIGGEKLSSDSIVVFHSRGVDGALGLSAFSQTV